MIELIRDDRVFWRQTGFEKAGIRVESGRVKDRIVEFMEIGDLSLELLMDVLRAADEPHRAHSKAMRGQSILCCLDDSWVVRETQVVISAKIEDFLTICLNFHILCRGYDTLCLVSTCFNHTINLRLADSLES